MRQPHSEETKEKIRQSLLGRKHSEETKEKIGKSSQGRIHSEETKEKMRSHKRSEETKEKIRQSRLGKPLPEETKEKLRGQKRSEETKEKIRQARLGTKSSDETKAKISAATSGSKNPMYGKVGAMKGKPSAKGFLGKKHTKETKQQMSKNNKGKILSPETRAKIQSSTIHHMSQLTDDEFKKYIPKPKSENDAIELINQPQDIELWDDICSRIFNL